MSDPIHIDFPLRRLCWLLVFCFVPAGVLGWATLLVPWAYGCVPAFCIGVVISSAVAALALGDHFKKPGETGSNGGCLAFVLIFAVLFLEGWANGQHRVLGVPLASAGCVTALTLLLAWINPGGISLFLLFLNALNAGGIVVGLLSPAPLKLELGLAAAFSIGSVVLGILVAVLRRVFSRPAPPQGGERM